MRTRSELLVLAVLVAVILTLMAALAQRSFTRPGPLPQVLVTVTPVATPTGGWWDRVRLTPPTLPRLPGVPAVGLEGASNGAAAGAPVPYSVVACPQAAVKIERIVTAGPGWWNVYGSAGAVNLEYWKAEISADGQGWALVYRSANLVTNGLLIEFNTRTVARGDYQLRLLAVDKTGNYGPPCTVRVSTR